MFWKLHNLNYQNDKLVCNSVATAKDVDGFTSQNLGNLVQGVGLGNSFVPCTPLAVLKILQNCIPNPDFMGKKQFSHS